MLTFFTRLYTKYSSVTFHTFTRSVILLSRDSTGTYGTHMPLTSRDPGISAGSTVQFLLITCFIAGDNLQKQLLCPGFFFQEATHDQHIHK